MFNEIVIEADYPITPNQVKTFEAFQRNKHLMLHGCAGTGKTFIMIYLAMKAVLSRRVEQSKVVIVRSMLPTRDIGFLLVLKKKRCQFIQNLITLYSMSCFLM